MAIMRMNAHLEADVLNFMRAYDVTEMVAPQEVLKRGVAEEMCRASSGVK